MPFSVVVSLTMALLDLRRPRVFAAAAAVLGVTLSGCTSWQRVGGPSGPNAEQTLTELFNPGAMYNRLGRLVSTSGVPFVGSVAFVPGRGDSTLAVVGVSLENRAFAFQREGEGYGARYRVDYEFRRQGAAPVTVSRDEAIRVAQFQETMRTDESVLLQQNVVLAPGTYTVTIRIRDAGSTQTGTATRELVAPAFTAGTVTAPILAYQVAGRGARSDSLGVILNPRGTVAYGGDTLLVYVEGVGFRTPTLVPIEVRDEGDSVIYRNSIRFTGAREIESQIIRLAPDSAPLGQLEIILGEGANERRNSALVAFSQSWVVTNFEDLVSLLRYFGHTPEVAALRDASVSQRGQLWRDFYRTTDPNPATPENEALERYFARLAIANTRFRDEGTAGWRTDRGEVFIALGEPDEVYDATPRQQGRYLVWGYNDLRTTLQFQDETGFGRYRLTPQSRADFERVKGRVPRY
jgi:GWxTD domain-containing protein